MKPRIRSIFTVAICISLISLAGSLQAKGDKAKGRPRIDPPGLIADNGGGHKKNNMPAPDANADVLAAYDELVEYIAELEDVRAGHRKSFTKKLSNSRNLYSQGKPCPAANILKAYLNQTSALLKRRYPVIGKDLYYRGQLLRMDVVSSLPEGKECSGHERVNLDPVIDIQQSDNKAFSATVTFGEPLQVAVSGGGEHFTEFVFPGLETGVGLGNGIAAGQPGIPVLHRLMAIPVGSKPVLVASVEDSGVLKNVKVYPLQPSAVDASPVDVPDGELPPPETFADPPFTKDEAAYQTDALYPAEPVSIRVIGQMRDVNIVQVTIAPMQYNPVTETVILNETVNFEVRFEGGTDGFIKQQSLNPFESYNNRSVVEASLINGTAVYEFPYVPDFPFLPFIGEELIIVTHPDFLAEANTLADWKREKGITTRVVKTGPVTEGGIGTTGQEIKDYLQDRYDSTIIRFSYVLLMGDAEFIPPWYRNSSGSTTTGTDLDYSLLAGSDLLADVGLARIPVDTAEQAETVVDKIIGYEKNPPFFATEFYDTASFPAYFQCCRTDVTQNGTTSRGYIETMELIRGEMVGLGYDVERLYFSDTTYHGGYTNDATPRRYRNGTALPSDLGPSSSFNWTAGQQDVIDAVNAGRFLVIHRDHGGQNGWVFPPLSSAAVTSLDNGNLLPVLFSVDCATGLFDNETAGGDYGTTNGGVYLLERMLREADGGVVGALGDTRNSPTWANNALTRGFSDAVFPGVLPAYGAGTSIRRLADILNYGKVYMFSQVGITQTAGSVAQGDADSNNVMWHAFGDPTQEIWTSAPSLLPPEFILEILAEHLRVSYAVEGAVITATQNGKPVGRAQVVNGEAFMELLNQPEPGIPFQLSASKEGAVALLLTPPVTTQGPDLMVELTGPEFAFPGQDIGDLLGVVASNPGDEDAPGSIDTQGNPTGEGYSIDIVLSTDEYVPDGFAVPAPDNFVEDGLLVSGRISRTPTVPAGTEVTLSVAPPINSDVGGVLPTEVTPGAYFLCARIDPGDSVDESDEDNNVDCLPITIGSIPSIQ